MENCDLCIMIIEIWSDIACPFCYLGFRQLELAIANFRDANPNYQNIDIIWKSFQLNPEAKYEPGKTVTQYPLLTLKKPTHFSISRKNKAKEMNAKLPHSTIISPMETMSLTIPH